MTTSQPILFVVTFSKMSIETFLGTWKFVSQSNTIEETLAAQGRLLWFDRTYNDKRNELGNSKNSDETDADHCLHVRIGY